MLESVEVKGELLEELGRTSSINGGKWAVDVLDWALHLVEIKNFEQK